LGVPTTGHKMDGADGTSLAGETTGQRLLEGQGLLDLSGLSLPELSALDDSVVAGHLRDLVRRRRCGSDSGERYSSFGSSI
jgi:hypothetical protein